MNGEEAVDRRTPRSASRSARLRRAWRALPSDRKLAAVAALGLVVTLFLPWYQETGLAGAGTRLSTTTASLTGWAAFSWVEAAVLLVAVGVLALLFLRAEGRAFHLPGGDGIIVTVAGGWTCVLVIWRIFDKQGVTSQHQIATTSGIEWGIIIALGVAGLLAYAGSRIRVAHQPEPPLPGDEPDEAADLEPWPEHVATTTTKRRTRRGRADPPGAGAPGAGAGAPAAGEGAPAAPAATAPTTVHVRRGRRRPAAWAEPVTWDEPAAITEPPVPPPPRGPTQVVEPPDDAEQLRIPLDDKPAD